MICPHEFFKPGSLKCARCGEPMQRQARHVRVGAPDGWAERRIASYGDLREVMRDGGRSAHQLYCPYGEDEGHADSCAYDDRVVNGRLVRRSGVAVGGAR